MKENGYARDYLSAIGRIAELIDVGLIEKMANIIDETRKRGGRIFFVGVGGGAGNASHAVNDFRKIIGIEAYAPTDNISELTARVNDEGWDSFFVNWLKCSRINSKDCIFVLSVGGGNAEKNVSNNIILALKYAKSIGLKILGIVGRDGGYTAKIADASIVIPTIDASLITPCAESFQSVLLHLLISHPLLKTNETKWESLNK